MAELSSDILQIFNWWSCCVKIYPRRRERYKPEESSVLLAQFLVFTTKKKYILGEKYLDYSFVDLDYKMCYILFFQSNNII